MELILGSVNFANSRKANFVNHAYDIVGIVAFIDGKVIEMNKYHTIRY